MPPHQPLPRLLLCGLLASTTAVADPPGAPNIPAATAKSTEAAVARSSLGSASLSDELPLPYTAWAGKGPEPPADTPTAEPWMPLARAKEWRRRPIELTAGLALFLPSCSAGRLDARGCLSVTKGSGVELALFYRPGPFFAVGVEVAASGFAAGRASLLSSSGGDARFFGVVGRLYFADDGRWDPYLALTLGGGLVTLRGSEADASASGLGARIAGGVDFVLGTHVRLGPTASLARWVTFSEQSCSGGICRNERAVFGHLVGFAALGFRLTGTWGDVL